MVMNTFTKTKAIRILSMFTAIKKAVLKMKSQLVRAHFK